MSIYNVSKSTDDEEDCDINSKHFERTSTMLSGKSDINNDLTPSRLKFQFRINSSFRKSYLSNFEYMHVLMPIEIGYRKSNKEESENATQYEDSSNASSEYDIHI